MERNPENFQQRIRKYQSSRIASGFFNFLFTNFSAFSRSFSRIFYRSGATLDTYYAAFRVPDLIFISIASLASVTVIIPFLLAKMSARQLADGDGDRVTDQAQKVPKRYFYRFSGCDDIRLCYRFFIYALLCAFYRSRFYPILSG